jgi:hypothetical protein
MDFQDSKIVIGSSAKLAQDVIYEFPLIQIPPNSQQLEAEYSILVRQYALTQDGYNFLSLMQLNTESLGSVFDVQPSDITGNIHCLSNPNEQVIGFISSGTVQQQRIFIKRSQIPVWDYSFSCSDKDIVVPNDSSSLIFYFANDGYVPIVLVMGVETNYQYCVDCTRQGGTTAKPSFWPN